MSAGLIKLGSLNLTLLDEEEQKNKINQLSNIFSSIQWDCSIIKLERPMDLSVHLEKQNRMLKNTT